MDSQTRFTREELYDQVWTTPGSKLATQFGLSDVGLSKICKKHRIPRPPPGYWVRVQHGATIRRAPLPNLTDDALKTVVITPHRFAQRRAPDSPRLPQIHVPDALTNPHPLVVASEKSLRGAKLRGDGLLEPRARKALDVSVGPDSLDRAMRILDALIKSPEEQGSKVSTTAEGALKTVATFGDVSVPFSLKEQLLRSLRELTPEEKKERFPNYFKDPVVYSPTRKLTLAIDVHSHDGTRLRWADGTKQRVESCLSRFVEGVLQCAEVLREEQHAEAERRKTRQEWERQRAEKVRQIREEEERLKRLLAEADSWDRCRRVRAYIRHTVRTIEAAEGMRAQPGSSLEKWADWATLHADRLDPAVKPPHSILDEKAKWEYGY